MGWNTIDLVPELDTPMLFVTGKKDEIVPYEQTIQLHDAATNARFKDIFIVKKGTHNDTWYVAGDKYMNKLKEFMDRANTEMIQHRKD